MFFCNISDKTGAILMKCGIQFPEIVYMILQQIY